MSQFKQSSFGGINHDRVNAQQAFNVHFNEELDRIINALPELVKPLIKEGAAKLAETVPDTLNKEDPVTRDNPYSEKAIEQRLIMMLGTKLTLGAGFFRN